jgi:hypothetical protein
MVRLPLAHGTCKKGIEIRMRRLEVQTKMDTSIELISSAGPFVVAVSELIRLAWKLS